MKKLIAYTDGSYDKKTKHCSLGVVYIDENGIPFGYEKKPITDIGYCNMRNVGGEILAAETAMEYALQNDYDSLDIYHDYSGIKYWATRKWKVNNKYTEAYVKRYDKVHSTVNIEFYLIHGHTNNTFNDMADLLAKAALGLIKAPLSMNNITEFVTEFAF